MLYYDKFLKCHYVERENGKAQYIEKGECTLPQKEDVVKVAEEIKPETKCVIGKIKSFGIHDVTPYNIEPRIGLTCKVKRRTDKGSYLVEFPGDTIYGYRLYYIPATFLTPIEKPETCRWCKGTGKIKLFLSVTDCEECHNE